MPRLSDLVRNDLSCWTRGPIPDVPQWADRRWRELQDLERALPDLDRLQTRPDGLDPELLALELGRVAQR